MNRAARRTIRFTLSPDCTWALRSVLMSQDVLTFWRNEITLGVGPSLQDSLGILGGWGPLGNLIKVTELAL